MPTFIKGDKHKCFILGEDTETFGPGQKMEFLPPHEFLAELRLDFVMSPAAEEASFKKLKEYDATQNKNSFCGNPLVYWYYWQGLLATRYKNGPTLMETYASDPEKYWTRVCKMDRRKGKPPSVRDAYELNKAITFFKPTTAKYLNNRFCEGGGKVVFDPCAGWGGRLLGTISAGNQYIGCDTNPYVAQQGRLLLENLSGQNAFWNLPRYAPDHDWSGDTLAFRSHIETCSCLETQQPDNSADFAFTSPPYANLEVYEGMTPFVNDDAYYNDFLIPMINKCLDIVKPGCCVAINIGPKYYADLTTKYGYPECVGKIDFLQQMGQQSGKKVDYVYLWTKDPPEHWNSADFLPADED